MRVAVVHDWLTCIGGAEKTLFEILKVFPDADLFAVVDFLTPKRAQTTFIQRLPFARRFYRTYLPLMPLAIEQLNLAPYDLVISLSHAVAKGVITHPDQFHLCYCCTPMRYAWDMQEIYQPSWLARLFLHRLRQWDVASAARVDRFVAISHFVARRIAKTYRRHADVLYPPVDVKQFTPQGLQEDFYLAASRLVPYKRVDLITKAFAQMPEKQLVVIGDGPERRRLVRTPNISYLGYQSDEVLLSYLQRARAFLFAAKEDFGILPLEAQACGTPVIAFGKGGVVETCPKTAHFFHEPTSEAICSAIAAFEHTPISREACRANALRFSNERFRCAFAKLCNQGYNDESFDSCRREWNSPMASLSDTLPEAISQAGRR